MVDARFSAIAATATLVVAILAAAKDASVVAVVWGLLTIGFVVRAAWGYCHRR